MSREFSEEFKSRVILESLKELETKKSLAKRYEPTPTQISTWRSLALKNVGKVFSSEDCVDTQVLYARIGELKVRNESLKKAALRG